MGTYTHGMRIGTKPRRLLRPFRSRRAIGETDIDEFCFQARRCGGFARVSLPASAGSRAGWRVISFTYNRRNDAEKKVSSLAHSHPELQPAVFTPSGHAPYLVSIGGVMDRDAAYALARRSRSLGLPHDTYAQNY
jgi:hypothetical protein